MKDFLIRSTEDLYVVRGTDRHGGPFEWATHDLPTAAKWAAGVIRRKGEASVERHVYHGGKAAFVFAETLENYPTGSPRRPVGGVVEHDA